MKIAVACESLTTVACHLGRAPLFLIYDTASGRPELVEQRTNPQADCDQQHRPPTRSGHESILAAVDGCAIVVARGMGGRLADDLAARGIKPVLIDDDVPPFRAARLAFDGQGASAAGPCSCDRPEPKAGKDPSAR